MTLSITSKGKYEISFKFTLEDAYGKPYKENLDDLFKIMPQQGTLIPVDRPTQVQVMFKSHSEINIQELPILKCHVIEPNMSETGETIASIPIKITGWFQNPGKLIQMFSDISIFWLVTHTDFRKTYPSFFEISVIRAWHSFVSGKLIQSSYQIWMSFPNLSSS